MSQDDNETANVLKDIRKLLIAVVVFGLFAWGVSALRDSQRASMDASRRAPYRSVAP